MICSGGEPRRSTRGARGEHAPPARRERPSERDLHHPVPSGRADADPAHDGGAVGTREDLFAQLNDQIAHLDRLVFEGQNPSKYARQQYVLGGEVLIEDLSGDRRSSWEEGTGEYTKDLQLESSNRTLQPA